MAVYTVLTNEEIAALVSERYGLGDLVFAVGIAGGVENTNYLLTVRGKNAKETRYVLTLFEKRVNAGELPFFMALMTHLASHGVVCPTPIPMQDNSVTGMLREKYFVLASFLEGKSISDIHAAHCAQVGSAVAKLHIATADFSNSRANNVGMYRWRDIVSNLGDRLNTLQDHLYPDVVAELDFLESRWPQNLPQGVVHADIFPDNVFFDDDGRCSGVIDFYFACTDMLAYDLMIALNAWCFDTQSHAFDVEKSTALLAAYQAKRAFTEHEKQAFPILARGAALRFLLTRAYDRLNAPEGTRHLTKDPLEYAKKLAFHQRVVHASDYGV